jgi:TatD DNase family protein
MFYDSHVHFKGLEGIGGAESLVARARQAGVGKMLAVGSCASMNALALAAARRWPDCVKAAIGYDRDQAAILPCREPGQKGGLFADPIGTLGEAISCGVAEGTVAAVGEIGLDFHYAPATADRQQALLREQLRLAGRFMLPVTVHSREADTATVDALSDHAKEWTGPRDRIGVLHCFTGSVAFATAVLDLGFCVSFSGIVTFRNAKDLRAVAATIPEERLLIETDTPYLAPEPHRGRVNEPAFVRHVAERLAQVRGCSVDRIAEVTTANALRLFGASPSSPG